MYSNSPLLNSQNDVQHYTLLDEILQIKAFYHFILQNNQWIKLFLYK